MRLGTSSTNVCVFVYISMPDHTTIVSWNFGCIVESYTVVFTYILELVWERESWQGCPTVLAFTLRLNG